MQSLHSWIPILFISPTHLSLRIGRHGLGKGNIFNGRCEVYQPCKCTYQQRDCACVMCSDVWRWTVCMMPPGTARTPICSLATPALMEALNSHTSTSPLAPFLLLRTHTFRTLFTASAFFSAPTIAPAPAVSTVRTENIIIPQTQNVTAESVTCGLIASRIWMCLQCIALPHIMRNSHFTSWLNDTAVN